MFLQAFPLLLLRVPLHTVLKLDATSPKYVKRAANGKVDLASTQSLDFLQIVDVSASASISDGYRAPISETRDELLVDARLQALIVRGVDEKFRAVRLKRLDGS